LQFIHVNLPKLLPTAREAFNDYKDLVRAYANGQMEYEEFAARVRRRTMGQDEDSEADRKIS
jgi:hypothetical protein